MLSVNLINEKICDNILNVETRKNTKKHLNYMELNQINIISINDKEYPNYLREIYNPPICLYIRGNKNLLNGKNVSIVGCRKCSQYGKETTKKLAYDLAKNKITIISGLANGIDSYAHLGAIYAKEKTIAVLANGLDTIYPKENYNIAKKILECEGAIVSEFPLGSKIEKINFISRNRIISGLSEAVVIVEAKKKSGSLITADFALEQGREVFAIPRKYRFLVF